MAFKELEKLFQDVCAAADDGEVSVQQVMTLMDEILLYTKPEPLYLCDGENEKERFCTLAKRLLELVPEIKSESVAADLDRMVNLLVLMEINRPVFDDLLRKEIGADVRQRSVEIRSLRARNEELEQAQKSVNAAQARLNALEEENARLQKSLTEAEKAPTALKILQHTSEQTEKKLRSQLDVMEKKNESLMENVKNLVTQRDNMAKSLAENKEHIKALQKETADTRKQNEELQRDFEQKEKLLKEAERENRRLLKMVAEAQQTPQRGENVIAELKSIYEQKEKKLNKELGDLRDKHAHLMRDYNVVVRQRNELKEKLGMK